jgi:hypothetical protein
VATTTKTDRRTIAIGLLGASLSLVGLGGSGCSSRPAPKATAEAQHPAPSARGLLELAPAAGLRWLVVGSPARIRADRELARSVGEIFAPERLDAFAESSGFRLDRVKLGAIAGYDVGTLYLAELEGSEAPVVRARFSARLVDGGVARSRRGVHRIVGTTTSGAVRALVTVDDRYLAFASGDATLARVVEAYADGRLGSPTMLDGAGLRDLPSPAPDTLLAFFAPGPFEGEWAGAAGGTLASADAVSIEARRDPGPTLHVTLTLSGAWEPSDNDLEKLTSAWTKLASSSTGLLLELDRASDFQSRFLPQFLTLSAHFPIGPLARGLRNATSSDVREILQLEAPATETSR